MLVQAYLFALMFSGFTVPAIDSGSTLFRWGVLVALAASALFGWRNPGLPAMMIAALGLFGAATAGFSPRPQYGFQFGVGLILMTGLAGGVMARNFPGVEGVKKLIGYFRVVAVVYAILAVSALADAAPGKPLLGSALLRTAVRDDRRDPPADPACGRGWTAHGPTLQRWRSGCAGARHPGASCSFPASERAFTLARSAAFR